MISQKAVEALKADVHSGKYIGVRRVEILLESFEEMKKALKACHDSEGVCGCPGKCLV